MYQIGLPARPPVPSVRRSPGRLSRGFMPGGDRILAMRLGSNLLLPVEPQPVVSDIDQPPIAPPEFALEHPQGQRIEHPALDRALEGPCAVHRIVALRHEERLGRVAELDVDLAVLEPLQQTAD